MSIANETLGKPLAAFEDYIFKAQAIPVNTNVVSGAFNLGKTQNALEIVVEVVSEITVNVNDTLTIDYLYGDNYATVETLYTVTSGAVTATTIPVGELLRFVVPTSLPTSGKVRLTTDDAGAVGSVDVYPILISR